MKLKKYLGVTLLASTMSIAMSVPTFAIETPTKNPMTNSRLYGSLSYKSAQMKISYVLKK